jgi:Cu(I)/Ag(I) efflux system membrane fusion protein
MDANENARQDVAIRSVRAGWLVRRILPVGVFFAAGILLIVALGIAQRIGWIQEASIATAGATSSAGDIYTCPMHPQIRQPGRGRCPICGMELVPAAAAAGSADALSVVIEPAQRRLANIQTAKVRKDVVETTIESVGRLAIDESRMATIASYIDGRIERLFADYTGVTIAKGDHLTVVYSPQLFAAQVEYLEAVRMLPSAGGVAAVATAQRGLVDNTRQRLREFGMTDEQIRQLDQSGVAQSRLTIYAPQGGTVVDKLVVEGAYVKAGDPIYRVAELSTVWLMLELFPRDASRIRFGQKVEAAVQSLPGEYFTGRVAFIDPVVDPTTRTVGVRVELLNDGRLRPGDYATATMSLPIGPQGEVYDADLAGKWISPMHPQIIRDAPGPCPICGMPLVPTSQYGFAKTPVPQAPSLVVPRTAVLMAGGNSVVYVETKPGTFELRPVTLGTVLKDSVVILDGVKEGDAVATSGNFLIDSQMQLSGKPSLIDVSRVAATKPSRKQDEPLAFPDIAPAMVEGPTGDRLAALFAAYFEIQRSLANDRVPSAEAVTAIREAALALAADKTLPAETTNLFQAIATKAEHLHHMKLAEARASFKPMSHAVVRLASKARATKDRRPYWHIFCSMVPEGGGDWLQPDDAVLNPYFGSEMLRCGDEVRTFKVPDAVTPKAPAATNGAR